MNKLEILRQLNSINMELAQCMEAVDDSSIIQEVYDRLADYIPQDFREVRFIAVYSTEDENKRYSYGMKYWVRLSNGSVADCFKLGYNPSEIAKLFTRINNEVFKPVRDGLLTDTKWLSFIMNFTNDGRVSVKYGYDDVSSDLSYMEKEGLK